MNNEIYHQKKIIYDTLHREIKQFEAMAIVERLRNFANLEKHHSYIETDSTVVACLLKRT